MLGAPVNEEGRGSLFYSTRTDSRNFMSGRNRLPNAAGVFDDSITDQYQGQGVFRLFMIMSRLE